MDSAHCSLEGPGLAVLSVHHGAGGELGPRPRLHRAGGHQVHAAQPRPRGAGRARGGRPRPRHHHCARGQLRPRPGRRARAGGGAGPAAALLAGPHHALLQVGAEAAVQRAVLLDVVRGVAQGLEHRRHVLHQLVSDVPSRDLLHFAGPEVGTVQSQVNLV